MFWIILLACLLSGAGSVALAGLALLLPKPMRQRITPLVIAYATGTLLAAACIGMIPHALQAQPATRIMPVVLAGFILFFLMEKVALWRHCHQDKCSLHSQAGFLVLIGDALHNFVDGVAIAVAFLTSVPLGIATTVAVFAHEIPQEIGDFFILLESGYSKGKAFFYNLLSSLSALLGALVAYAGASQAKAAIPYVMAISAASFLYIALADLIPAHRIEAAPSSTAKQLVLIMAGIATIALFHIH